MASAISRIFDSRTFRHVALVAVSGFAIGYANEVFALDRGPFNGGFVSDARPGYGAEKPRYGSERIGYGAEREYYGAENRRSKPARHRRDNLERYRSNGSFIEFRDDAYDDVDAFEPSPFGIEDGSAGVYPGFGGTTSGSFVYFDDPDADRSEGVDSVAAGKARVIDVETERLDRRDVGSSGVQVSYSGATKIIRIASSGTSAPAASDAPALAPWSDAWERYCKRAHRNFDPARGTFIGADGATRFCTGN